MRNHLFRHLLVGALAVAIALVAQGAAADSIVTTIPVGFGPVQEQFSPDGSRLIVSNETSNSVSIISTSTNAVVATVPVGVDPGPIRFLPDGTKAYVANFLDDTVSAINMSTNSVSATIPVGRRPVTLSTSAGGGKVYVVNEDGNSVSVICTGRIPADCSGTDVVVKTVQVGNGPWGVNINGSNPSDLAVNPSTNRIYVANNGSKNVAVIDGATNTVTAMISVGTGPRGVAVDPGTNRVFVSNNTSNTLSVINGATGGIITTVNVENGPAGVAVDESSHRVFVANLGTSTGIGNTVSVIDETPGSLSEHQVIATVNVGEGPSGVAANSVTHRVYVTNNGTSTVPGSTVSVIDEMPGGGNEHNVVETVNVGAYPRGVAVNKSTNRVYVANGGSTASPGNTVSIINENVAPASVSTVTVGSGPSRVGVNSTTNKIYVSNNTGPGTTLSVIDGASGSVSGTINVGTGASGIAVNGGNNRIYAGNKVSDSVSVIDGGTNSVIATASLGSSPHTILRSPDGTSLYIANQFSNLVTVLNTATDNVAANIAVGSSPGSIQFLPDGSKAYIANRGCADTFECTPLIDPSISVINTGTKTVTATIGSLGIAGAAPHAMRITPSGSKLYVINKHANEVKVIATSTNAVSTTIPLTSGTCSTPGDPALACPVRIELTYDGSRAYVVDQGPAAPAGSLSVICTGLVPASCGGFGADMVMATVGLGGRPIDLEIECAGAKAYVSNSASNSVSVVGLTGVSTCPAAADKDGDGIVDSADNCPDWPNPTQALPPWTVPAGDTDCDGYHATSFFSPRASENTIGTVPTQHCAATSTFSDEPLPDAWPPDFNDNQLVNGSDILSFNGAFAKHTTDPPITLLGNSTPISRFDLNGSGLVNGADVLQLNPFFSKRCAP